MVKASDLIACIFKGSFENKGEAVKLIYSDHVLLIVKEGDLVVP